MSSASSSRPGSSGARGETKMRVSLSPEFALNCPLAASGASARAGWALLAETVVAGIEVDCWAGCEGVERVTDAAERLAGSPACAASARAWVRASPLCCCCCWRMYLPPP